MRELVDRDRTRPCGRRIPTPSIGARTAAGASFAIGRHVVIQAGTAPAPDRPRPAKSTLGDSAAVGQGPVSLPFRRPRRHRSTEREESDARRYEEVFTAQRLIRKARVRCAATSPQATSSSIDPFRGHAEPAAAPDRRRGTNFERCWPVRGPQSSRFQCRAMPLSLTPLHRRAGPIGWQGFRLPLGDMQCPRWTVSCSLATIGHSFSESRPGRPLRLRLAPPIHRSNHRSVAQARRPGALPTEIARIGSGDASSKASPARSPTRSIFGLIDQPGQSRRRDRR